MKESKLELAKKVPIFHARFGKWENESSLVFGDRIDVPCNIAIWFGEEDPHDPKNHVQIAEGIFVVAMAGMDDSIMCIYQDAGNKGARFEIAHFSWSETPVYLHFRDRRSVLEITHDNRVDVDGRNEEYQRLHPKPPADEKSKKIYVIPLDEGKQFSILG